MCLPYYRINFNALRQKGCRRALKFILYQALKRHFRLSTLTSESMPLLHGDSFAVRS